MNVEVRISRSLCDQVRSNLIRPHAVAAERLGFLFGKLADSDTLQPLVLLHRYRSLRDEQYVDDPSSGGRMDASAIRETMQETLDGRPDREGVFHVHLHDHDGPPILSPMDRAELPELIHCFRAISSKSGHGILLLSNTHAHAWVWLPQANEPVQAARVIVVGTPLHISERNDNVKR
jgi:hypothetical protein